MGTSQIAHEREELSLLIWYEYVSRLVDEERNSLETERIAYVS